MNFGSEIRLLNPDWRDVLEIIVVSYVFYRLLLLIQGKRALQLLLGIVVLVLAYAIAWALKLAMLTHLLALTFTYGAFAALIVFQPELRSALAQLGQTRVPLRRLEASDVADEIADAVERMSQRGTGAIIAIERDVALGEYVESGTHMDATLSADLLSTIFTPYSPLHDGAVIIRGDRIIGAGCILPLSQKQLDRSLGTRHRATVSTA
jgi:diadenylate cyclase